MENKQRKDKKRTPDGKIRRAARTVGSIAKKMAEYSNEELVTNNTFEKLRRRNKLRTLRRSAFYISIALALSLIFMFICASAFFKVGDIQVEGSTIYRDNVIIQASGIEFDENLMRVSPHSVENRIVMNYPYIKSVKTKLVIPATVKLSLTEDCPRYYTYICGEYFVMSDDLRILQRVKGIGELKATYDLIELKTPAVSRAVVGKKIVFEKPSNFDFVIEFVDWISHTDLIDHIQLINVSDKYRIYITYDHSYKIIFGRDDELDIKLVLVHEILNTLQQGKGIIDVQNIEPSFALYDENVDLS